MFEVPKSSGCESLYVTYRDYSEIVRPTLEEKVLRPCAVSRTLLLSGSQPTARDIQAYTGLFQNRKWRANYVAYIPFFSRRQFFLRDKMRPWITVSKILLIRHTATVPPHNCESFTPVLFDRFSCRLLSTAEGAFALSLCLVEDSKQPYSDSHHACSQLFRLLYCLISPKKPAVFTNSYCTPRVICNR